MADDLNYLNVTLDKVSPTVYTWQAKDYVQKAAAQQWRKAGIFSQAAASTISSSCGIAMFHS